MGVLTRAAKNLGRRKVRSIIVIVALSLALTLLIILPPSINAGKATTQTIVNDLNENADLINMTVTGAATEIDCNLPINFGPSGFVQPLMNDSYYANLTSIPDVTNVVPVLQQVEYKDNYFVDIIGVPVDNGSILSQYPSLLPANITSGRNLQAGDSGDVVLEEHLANHFDVGVGGTINLFGTDFTVVGIEGQEALNATCHATMSLTDAQAITNATGQESEFKVFVDNIDNVNTVSDRIKNIYPSMQVSAGLSQENAAQQIQDSIDEQVHAAQTNMNQIQGIGQMEISIAVIADIVIVLFIMLYSVRERTREIGTFKALGASNTTILGQLILEGVILSVVAAVVAVAVGVVVAPVLPNLLLPHSIESETVNGMTESISQRLGGYTPVSVAITPEVALVGIGVALGLGVIGTIYPALKAAKTKPAEAMRYE